MTILESVTGEHLSKFGFLPFDENECPGGMEFINAEYVLNLGHSRRGQFYYLVIYKRVLSLFASKPDGSGGPLEFPKRATNFIFSMQRDGLFENENG